jgi:L-rhamnose mutarotase
MERFAFKMKLMAGFEEEYRKRHDKIWPELKKILKDSGISDYTIFLDEETLTLFAVQKLRKGHSADTLKDTDVVKRWWEYMSDIMETQKDLSPVSTPLKEVFHLD